MFKYYNNVHPYLNDSFQVGWITIDMNVIINLLDFIGSYKFYAKFDFHGSIQKLHEFHVITYEWCLYVFNIFNIQIDETFFLNGIHEFSCLIHKNHIANFIQNYIMIISQN
jgi:hypothetical protein